MEIQPIWKDFSALQRNSNVKLVTSLDISLVFVIKRGKHHSKSRRPKAHQLEAGTVYAQERVICSHPEDYSSSDDYFCLQIKVQHTQASLKKIPTPTHLITNLVYRLKLHHTRNQYLRARVDTCVDVNIMPASIHRLVFKDPELKKLASSNMENGTYATDSVKNVGSCKFYLVCPDPKMLQEVAFFVARNEGSVLLSCTTTKVLGLIQLSTRFEYLPPRASLITSSVDHPKKTKCQVTVHSSKTTFTVLLWKNVVPKSEIPNLITAKEQILQSYPTVFEGLADFQAPHTTYSLILV